MRRRVRRENFEIRIFLLGVLRASAVGDPNSFFTAENAKGAKEKNESELGVLGVLARE
jgi:hypothetical protein